jgi:hypothetical protein
MNARKPIDNDQRCQELPFGRISEAEPRLSEVAVIDNRQRTSNSIPIKGERSIAVVATNTILHQAGVIAYRVLDGKVQVLLMTSALSAARGGRAPRDHHAAEREHSTTSLARPRIDCGTVSRAPVTTID